MAKLTKSDLKKIMKECLVEILEENGLSLVSESTTPTQPKVDPLVSPPAPSAPARPIENAMLKENVNLLAGSIGITNPDKQDIFASIFEDTALHTLQEQREHGQGAIPTVPVNPAAIEKEVKQLEELSVDGDIGRWAQVALGGRAKK